MKTDQWGLSNLNKEKKIEKKNNEQSLGDMRNNTQKSNIHIIRVSEGEGKEYGANILFEEIMGKNFSHLVKDINLQIQKAQ